MKVAINGIPGWLGNYVSNELWKNKSIKVNEMYFGEPATLGIWDNTKYFFNTNVLNYQDCLKVTEGCDVAVHIVGIINPKKVKDFYSINVMGTDNMVRAAVENNVKRFIYISSNSAYGCEPYAMNEMTQGEPYMNYGISKVMAENIVISKCFTAGMEYIILRPCWFYGEGQPDRQTKLFNMIAKGKPMIFGNGENLRSMTYIGNLTDAIMLSIKTKDHNAVNEDYWIADSNPYATNEIYKTIFDELSKFGLCKDGYHPRYIPGIACKVGRVGDKVLQKVGMYNQYVHVLGEMDQTIACDITKARKLLGYEPQVSLKEGMRRSIKWCVNSGKILC